MMLTNQDTLWAIAQARQEELLKEIRMRQILRQMAKTKHRNRLFWRQLSWRLGGSMISIGHRLQAQQIRS